MAEPLSPEAQVIWDAFNEKEAGVFVDYGDKLAAALRVAVDLAAKLDPLGDSLEDCFRGSEREHMRGKFYRFAAELEDR